MIYRLLVKSGEDFYEGWAHTPEEMAEKFRSKFPHKPMNGVYAYTDNPYKYYGETSICPNCGAKIDTTEISLKL